jgi:formate/nitrite transporter FocA (FNT family)
MADEAPEKLTPETEGKTDETRRRAENRALGGRDPKSGNGGERETSHKQGLSESEQWAVRQRTRLRPPVLYSIIKEQGEDELDRPTSSLWWSGIAAGLVMGASVLAEGFLLFELQGLPATGALVPFGYSVGFMIVIMGRMQLFTENTVTAVLPFVQDNSVRNLRRLGRLWGLVLIANLIGSLMIALLIVHGGVIDDAHLAAIVEVASSSRDLAWWEVLLRGLPAGFLVASIVWILPSASGNDFWVILVLTYVIAIGGFTHVVAGGTEAFVLMWSGIEGVGYALFIYILPSLIGNIIGGTLLFALLAYAQVREEL